MSGTFTRDEISNYGKQAAEEIETPAEEAAADEEVADEVAADETVDEAVDVEVAARPAAAAAAAAAAAVEREPDEQPLRFPDQIEEQAMPDLTDEDIEFDNDKYREKMAKWVKDQGRIEARRMLQEEQNDKVARKSMQSVEAKITAFEKDHPDFKTVVRENTTLARYQLHPEAGKIIARSKHTAELLYRFGKDIALAVRTAQASPVQQGIIVDRMIAEIESSESSKSAPQTVQRQQTLTRKGPVTREQVLSGKQSMADIARASREKKMKSRFYGR